MAQLQQVHTTQATWTFFWQGYQRKFGIRKSQDFESAENGATESKQNSILTLGCQMSVGSSSVGLIGINPLSLTSRFWQGVCKTPNIYGRIQESRAHNRHPHNSSGIKMCLTTWLTKSFIHM